MLESKPQTIDTFIPEEKVYADASGPKKAEVFVWKTLPNPYNVLVLPSDATDKQIQAQYRKLAKEYHPDTTKHAPEVASELFILIDKAYKLLSDPRLKRIVDSTLNGPQKIAPVEQTTEKTPAFNHPTLQQQYDLFLLVKKGLVEDFHHQKIPLEKYNTVFRGIQIKTHTLFVEALDNAKDLNTLFADITIDSFLNEGFLSPYDYSEFRLRYLDKRQQLQDDQKLHTLAAKFSGENTQA